MLLHYPRCQLQQLHLGQNSQKAQNIYDHLRGWKAHNVPLAAGVKIIENHFIIVALDESKNGASGCSIDSSVGVVRAIMKNYKVDLLNRMIFAYLENDKVELVNRLDFVNMIKEGKITDDTIVFNNLVKDKAEFESKWEVRLVDSWHKQLA